jgi:hypothetical protein
MNSMNLNIIHQYNNSDNNIQFIDYVEACTDCLKSCVNCTKSVNYIVNFDQCLSRVYIGEGYSIMPVTATVTIYLHWPPWAMQHR